MTLSLTRINRQISSLAIAGLIVILALFGGVQFYWLPVVPAVFLAFGSVAVATAIGLIWRGQRPPLLWPALVILAAMVISTWANLDIWPTATSRLSLAVVAIAVMILAHDVTHETIFDGLYRTALIWPAVYFVCVQTRWGDNPNIIGFWLAIFALVSLTRRNHLSVPLFIVHCSLVVVLGSRGAILAIAVGVYTLYALRSPLSALRSPLIILVGVAGLLGLAAWRPGGTMHRLLFWRDAIQATLIDPIFGVGPGGLYARELIDVYPHAHNFILSGLAETGLIGLLAGLLATWRVYASRFMLHVPRSTLAIAAGILAHSLVDQPLWWPGPLLLAAIVAGSIKERDKKYHTFGEEMY